MAKILIVEDDEETRDILIAIMEKWGHEVVGVASTLKEALAEAKIAGTKEVQIAIVDGNLGSGADETKDGEAVSAELREYAPDVRIIAHTLQENGDYGHFFVPKDSPLSNLKGAIEKALTNEL